MAEGSAEMSIQCPKCGYLQEQGAECLRCGIIFERCHQNPQAPRPASISQAAQTRSTELLRRAFRIFRWASLAVSLLAIILVLIPSKPPRIITTSDSARQAEAKVREFQETLNEGIPKSLELDESELNGWIKSHLALQRTTPPIERSALAEDPGAREEAAAPAPASDPAAAEVKASVRDVRIALENDLLRAYIVFDFHGKELSLELDGHLRVKDGYLQLEPTGGQLGSLPLLGGTLEKAAQRLLDDPKNRKTFRLPPSIRDMRIVNSNLVIIPR